jgi:hypothetical protein
MSNLDAPNTGRLPTGDDLTPPVAGIAKITTTPLAANQVWDSGVLQYNGATTIDYQIVSDAPGTFIVTYYAKDLVTPLFFMPNAVNYNSSAFGSAVLPFAFQSTFNAKGYGVKFVYTNGSTSQTQFLFAIGFGQSSQETQQSAVTAISDTNKASVNKGTLQGKENATGARKEITTTTTGSKVGMDVNITSGFTATDTSALATSANQTSELSRIGALTDTAVVDPTVSASMIALLKGLLSRMSPSTAVVTSPTVVANVSATLLAANPLREGAAIFSESGTVLIKLGATASATSYTQRIVTNGYYEVPYGYNGIVTAFSTAAATVRVTEIS